MADSLERLGMPPQPGPEACQHRPGAGAMPALAQTEPWRRLVSGRGGLGRGVGRAGGRQIDGGGGPMMDIAQVASAPRCWALGCSPPRSLPA